MPANKAERERRWHVMVTGWIDMKRGLWIYEKPFRQLHDKKGNPLPNRRALLAHAGYSINSPRTAEKFWNNPKFQADVTAEEKIRDATIVEAADEMVAQGKADPLTVAMTMLDIVAQRLAENPDSVKTADLLKHAPSWAKLGLEIQGKRKLPIGKQTNVLIMDSRRAPGLDEHTMKLLKEYREDTIDGEVDDSVS